MSTLIIRQGETCTLLVTDLVDDDGQPFDPAGWSVHAMARPTAQSLTLWQEWATDPTADQGAARVVDGAVELDVPPAMSAAWTWSGQSGVLHVEITEPTGEQRVARVGEARVYLDPEAVRE